MTIQQLKCLCATVQYGNFSSASDEIFLSQSTVSKNIIALEQIVGFKILERKGRSNVLTEKGKEIMPDIWTIVSVYDHLDGIIQELNGSNDANCVKSVKLCCIPIIVAVGVVDAIKSFGELYPQESVELSVAEESRTLAALYSNACELAFCSDIELDDAQIQTYPFCEQKFAVFVAQNHPLATRDSVVMRDLENYKLILSGRDTGLRSICINACRDSGFEPCVPMDINGYGVALEYIKNTDYVYIGLDMPHTQKEEDIPKKLKLENSPTFHYVLARHKGTPLTPTARKFIQFLCPDKNKEID